ncbi:MAG: hypothetical protein GX901_02785 [Lentisphaerae bacterium]|nr:hypothetical protein [Lentisphaerota bacterium]
MDGFELQSQTELAYSSNGWRGLVAEQWSELLADYEAWRSANPGELVVEHRSRQVSRVETAQGRLYVKEILALTDASLRGRAPGSFLKWVLRPSRALAAWRVSQKLLQAGFHCALPVLAIRRRGFLGYPQDVFITEDVQAKALDELFGDMSLEEKTRLARLLGSQIARLHQAGFVHGDCIMRNLCLDKQGNLIYLDNDRSKKCGRLAFSRSRRNLAQLGYSARRTGADAGFVRLMFEVYAEALAWKPQYKRKTIERLEAGIERRLEQRRQADLRK